MEHNNCGGFCVRAGQGHFAKLIEVDIEVFKYHAKQEEIMRSLLDRDVSILKKTKNKVTTTYPLSKLLEDYRGGGSDIDVMEIGGCGCFVTDDPEDDEYLDGARWTSKDLVIVRFYDDRK